jgi:hypothetical protein
VQRLLHMPCNTMMFSYRYVCLFGSSTEHATASLTDARRAKSWCSMLGDSLNTVTPSAELRDGAGGCPSRPRRRHSLVPPLERCDIEARHQSYDRATLFVESAGQPISSKVVDVAARLNPFRRKTSLSVALPKRMALSDNAWWF